MKLQRPFGALLALALLLSPVRATEQASYVTPTTGPMSMATFTATYLNPALRALVSCSWGPSAPLNGPSSAALPYQCWANTTANPVVFNHYDGTSWVPISNLDTAAHKWSALATFLISGGSSGTVALAPQSAASGTLTLPNGNDTLVGRATTDTLTNKTLTSPVLSSTTPTAAGALGFGASVNFGDGSANHALVGADLTQTLTNKTIVCANQSSCVVRLGSDVTGNLPNANLATMAANTVKANATGGSATPTDVTAASARSSSLLNIDQMTTHGDSIYTILATDRKVVTSAPFTASRAWTLPPANAVNAGQELIVADLAGGVTASNTLVITRAGADTINGGTTATISAANGAYLLVSDGTSKWTAQSMGAASGGGVTSVTCGTGLSGGTITTSGTCAVSLSTLTNSLGADVALNNTANYFDGPSVAQGTSGTWCASGTVTLNSTAQDNFFAKLWDGTTVIASAAATDTGTGVGFLQTISLSGCLASPAGNLRISARDPSTTGGNIKFNSSGNSKDSTITVKRVQ